MKTSEILLDLFDLALTGIAGASRRIALMEKPTPEDAPNASVTEVMWSRVQAGKTYLHALFRLTVFCLLFPIPILAIALFTNWGWLTAIVGMFWTLCSLLLLLIASPLGLIMEFVLGGFKGIGDRYLKFSLGVFLVELLFTLYALIVPVQNNPSAISIVIIASAVLGVLAARGVKTPITQGFVGFVVTLVFIVFTFSFFFPQSFLSLTKWGGKLDTELSKIVDNPRSLLKNPNSASRETDAAKDIRNSAASGQTVSARSEATQKEPTKPKPVAKTVLSEPRTVPSKPEEKFIEPGLVVTLKNKKVRIWFPPDYEIVTKSVELLSDMKVRIEITIENKANHTTWIWLADPESYAFIADQSGRRYSFHSAEGFSEELPPGIPLRFTLTFAPVPKTTSVLFLSFRCVRLVPPRDRGNREPDPTRGKDIVLRELRLR